MPINVPRIFLTAHMASILEQSALAEDDWELDFSGMNHTLTSGWGQGLRNSGTLPAFALGAEHLILHEDIKIRPYLPLGESDPEEEDIRLFLQEVRRRWWSNNPPPPELVARVVLTDESMASWNERVDEGRELPPSW